MNASTRRYGMEVPIDGRWMGHDSSPLIIALREAADKVEEQAREGLRVDARTFQVHVANQTPSTAALRIEWDVQDPAAQE